MRCLKTSISLQEIPGEISLIFEISNCPHRCPECHSKELWQDAGEELSINLFSKKLLPYEDYISAVIFFGGEWDKDLILFLQTARAKKLKTCLYTGADDIGLELKNELDYLKTGKYLSKLGGLESSITNQRFWDLKNNVLMNNMFIKDNFHTQTHTTKGEHDAKANGESNFREG